jgi:hypothetical protein
VSWTLLILLAIGQPVKVVPMGTLQQVKRVRLVQNAPSEKLHIQTKKNVLTALQEDTMT